MLKHALHVLEAFFVYLFFYACKLLPMAFASYACGKLCQWIGHYTKVSKVADVNLMRCFPNYSEAKRRNIIQQMWNNLGRMIGEFPHWYKMSSKEFMSRVKINDISGEISKGGILVSAHYSNWEILPRVLQEMNLKVHIIHRKANNPYVDAFINTIRQKTGVTLLRKGLVGVKEIVKALKAGHSVGMLVDQKTNNGIDVPFFGIPSKTTAAPANLAIKFNIPIFLAYVKRTGDGNYQVNILPPLKFSEGADVLSVMSQINRTIEEWIRESPSDWFWVHRRWNKSLYCS
ncbi:hypothetical protein EDM53_04240 [Rickettsiales endosymbiont of Peranema trichophorum]|uniref:lysophospholipid acyltransferase family protein n=1 Tax=Rickettsiales endosymbiont of Peranema trichophorum TaxID=2486577 RepID=UPI0010233531|nr:lysophospholipid acyltransferase family protein [Rickettsiales endosymbiont of Peranema trichophorum]RZI46339.1 hypothetical protein EDM53_04240 [Rickettsiales endosymbiont of Peranema trichophorum]